MADNSPFMKTSVLLVDDSAIVRLGVRRLFHVHPKFEVCGEAEGGREAIEKAPTLRPALIVLDLSMPLMNGLEAAPLLIKILPDVCIILFSNHESHELQELARTAGIHAVVHKSKATTLVTQAESLMAGGRAAA